MARALTEPPWERIRREWESTPISTAKLARRYGIRSATTIDRKRVAEGWMRDADRPMGSDEPRLGGSPLQTDDGEGQAHRVLTDTDRLDAGRIFAPRTLADVVSNQLHTQLALAIEVQRVGLLLLERVEAVLQPPSNDPVTEAEVLANVQRLIRVNPDRDTLANLLSTAAKTIDLGCTMERRALETAQAPQNTAPRELSPGSKQLIRDAIDAGADYAERLRQLALEIQAVTRQREIEAIQQVH
ncbi:MAG TPA: hypothetical protein VE690_00140 [Rhodopila sp.]|nr:hypothetical protein [Rhodopila sp.]